LVVAALFNDRTTIAWWIVAAYFGGAAAAFWAGRAGRSRDRRFWFGTAILLILLGLNKQLDLQSVLTSTARSVTRHAGWYPERRAIQGLFLLALVVAAIAVVLGLLKWLRRSSAPVKSAALGIALLLVFIVIRAASFHHIDAWVTVNIGGLRRGWWLELAGIAMIAASALAYRNLPRRKSR
jgi:hypothetical protein